jgi:hypothetical protein
MRDGAAGGAWRWAASALVLAGLPLAANAQATVPPQPAGQEGVSSFPAAFFAPYNPVNANDMVARVPGFELKDGDERRGFAAAGNLLINGERPSSKTAASELLKRIPASSVVRIELISGSNAGLDVRGQSQLVNVVVARTGPQGGGTTWSVGLRHLQYSNRIGWLAQASRAFQITPEAELGLDIQFPNLLGRGDSRDTLVTGAGVVTGARRLLGKPQNIGAQGSATLRWRPSPVDVVNANIQVAPTWNHLDTIQAEVTGTGAPRSLLIGRSNFDRNYTAELGADWEHQLGPGLSTKLVTLISNGSVDQGDVFQIQTFPNTFLTRTQDRTTRNGERIARGRIKWTLSPAHTLEFGGEGAFNYRDTTFGITNQLRGGPLVVVPLAVSNARVEETRGEVFASDIWTVSPTLTLEYGLAVEASRITQTGDQQKERSFRYVKPRATATWVLGPTGTLRASLVRDVAQLDFAEFSSTVDFVNAASTQGNPNLVPEKAWKARLEWEARLAPRTALTLTAFADRVDDVRDLVDIAGADAFGNIGRGSRLGLEARAATPLAFIGLPNAELRFNGVWQRTRVTDPITGEKRSFSSPLERQGTLAGSPTLNLANKDWAYVLSFRQNAPALQLSWGGSLVDWSDRQEYRRAEAIRYERPMPRLDLFIETTAIKPVTARIFANNLLSPRETRTREFFRGSRASGAIDRVEFRRALGGPEGLRTVGFQVSGRF